MQAALRSRPTPVNEPRRRAKISRSVTLNILHKVITKEPDFQGVVCPEGGNACPPEDVGGIWRYFQMQEALKDPEHEYYQEFCERIGPKFNPCPNAAAS